MKAAKKFFCVVLFLSVIFISCVKSGSAPQIPTTIIQVQQLDSNGNPIDQKTINYEIGFEPIIEFFGAAYPVHILSMASINALPDGTSRMSNTDDYIGDIFGDFGAAIYIKGSSNETIPLKLEIEASRFINKSSIEIKIQQDKEIEVFPRIAYDYHALERLIQPASENVYFRLYSNSVQIMEKMEVVRFHSVNEVPFAALNRKDPEQHVDLTWLFSAYVNEDDPSIDKILHEALQIGTADKIGFGNEFSFSGYGNQENTGLSVDLQALAIWSVFLSNKIKYSNITTTSNVTSSNDNKKVWSQYVRTLGESFGNAQANCVDGSVLFASVLRKIGIDPMLILVPGHMFLGYVRDPELWELLRQVIFEEDGEDADYDWFNDEEAVGIFTAAFGFLETTMLGNVDLSKYTSDESFLGKAKRLLGFGTTQSKVTLESFLAAQEVGEMQFAESIGNFFDDENPDYRIIDISHWRVFGIRPVTRY